MGTHTNFHAHDLTDRDDSWMRRAACRHTTTDMFPTDVTGFNKARQICEGCPVREVCLEYALTNRIDDGCWGGVSERGRRRILKDRRGAV